MFTIKQFSIKQLSMLGFTLVALPLVLLLIYSAIEIRQLAQFNANAILDAANIEKNNKALDEVRIKMERYASQYIVLADQELYQGFTDQYQLLPTRLKFYQNNQYPTQLTKRANAFLNKAEAIKQYVTKQASTSLSLTTLEQYFVELAAIQQGINQETSAIVTAQANNIKAQNEQISETLLMSLWLIPVVIIVAGIFIVLLTTPLKQLTQAIEQLEHGQSQRPINVQGSAEIKAIANALERMRSQLHSLELQKSSFIQHISHELKTPLAAIKEGTELLYDNSVGELNNGQQEINQIIRSSANKLQILIEDLLNFNVVLDSTSLQQNELVDLNLIVQQVVATQQLELKRKNIKLLVNAEKIQTYSNSKQLSVILDNLLSNAIKYSPDQGAITISIAHNDKHLIITVADQGIGISDDIKTKIFDAFYQGPAPENSSVKSSGLGLTIVKELVMRLNGTMNLTSQTADQTTQSIQCGTSFSLTFPYQIPETRLQ